MKPRLPADLRALSPRAIAASAAVAAVAVLAGTGQLTGRGDATVSSVGWMAVLATLVTATGVLVLVNVRGHPVGVLLTAAGLVAVAEVLALSWASWEPLAWVSQWAWWPPFGLILLSLMVFPDGRLPSRRWWPLVAAIAVLAVVTTLMLAVAALDHPRTLVTDVTDHTPRAALLLRIGVVSCVLALLLSLVGVAGSLAVRWRQARGETRDETRDETRPQLVCLLAGALLLFTGIVLDIVGVPGAWAVGSLAVPVAMAVAILRFRLYGLDQVVDRTLVWLVMTLLVIAGFVLLVAVLRGVVVSDDDTHASLAATGLIAVAFEPLRRRVQRVVDHLVYGDRDDPYTFIETIGDVTESAGRPDDVLPSLAGAVARSMRVPYVGVELSGADGPRIVADHGRTDTTPAAFDMVTHGEQVGRLLVAPRSRRGRFSSAERRLLANAALHAAVATEAARLITDLRESRESLVLAREEERRRLRRDLHDGFGPTLAGLAMQVSAARRAAAGNERAEASLGRLAADMQTCTGELRQLVDELRPPALDNGLASAVRAQCRRFAGAEVVIEQDVDDDLGVLPAAVEMAAYRIAGEALTNVVRHSGATTCTISVRRDDALTLTVLDDGTGIDPGAHRGQGLDSMHARATELGGTLGVGRGAGGGTRVHLVLPLPPWPGDDDHADPA